MAVWKPIERHPLYEVSDTGQVRSLDQYVNVTNGHKALKKGRVLKPWKATNGYLVVQLTNNKREMVHRLVAKAFVDNPNNKPCVNHIDGDKTNATASNLEWVTHSENMLHAKDSGLADDRVSVQQIDRSTKQVLATYRSIKEASKATGIEYSSLAYCVRGKYKTSGGFIWKRVTTIQ